MITLISFQKYDGDFIMFRNLTNLRQPKIIVQNFTAQLKNPALSVVFQFLVEENETIQKEQLQEEYNDEYPWRNNHLTILVSNLFFQLIRSPYFFENLNFYFMKTAKIPVYRSIALSVYKIDYTLRCLEYIC